MATNESQTNNENTSPHKIQKKVQIQNFTNEKLSSQTLVLANQLTSTRAKELIGQITEQRLREEGVLMDPPDSG